MTSHTLSLSLSLPFVVFTKSTMLCNLDCLNWDKMERLSAFISHMPSTSPTEPLSMILVRNKRRWVNWLCRAFIWEQIPSVTFGLQPDNSIAKKCLLSNSVVLSVVFGASVSCYSTNLTDFAWFLLLCQWIIIREDAPDPGCWVE